MKPLSVRLRLALTVMVTGVATALGVLVAVALAFERFEREAAYARADAFLGRVVALQADLHALQRRDPEQFTAFLRSLLLFEPDNQLYLLAPDGTVLASTGSKQLPAGFKVAIAPVQQAAAAAAAATAAATGVASAAAGGPGSPNTATSASAANAASAPRGPRLGAAYVMGDDPEHMEHDAVVAARALTQPSIRPSADIAGYLYIVCRKPGLPPSRLARLAEHLAGPALGPVLAVVLLATLLAAWVITAVTRPLAVLSAEVAAAARAGFDDAPPPPQPAASPGHGRLRDDEFGRLQMGFQMLLARLRAQWDRLRRLDAFRRESVSNLSHDLRSPLTAAAASLETLQRRWQAGAASGGPSPAPDAAGRAEDNRLVEVALRNTHSAARLVRALGDLAVLDEAGFRLRLARIDLAEMLDDVALRFAERAAAQGVALRCDFDGAGNDPAAAARGHSAAEPLAAAVDVELIERALANLLDNALRHTPRGGSIVLAARPAPAAAEVGPSEPGLSDPGRAAVRLTVRDSGSGIAAEDLAHLFDRHFRGRHATDAARAEGSKGLGLAIVQRIVELHGGRVDVASAPGQGTTVTLDLPAHDAG